MESPNDRGKKCSQCGEWKPLTEFFKNRRVKRDGRVAHCKDCFRRLYDRPRSEIRKTRAANWNAANVERVRYLRRKATAKRHGYGGEVFSDIEWLYLKAHYGFRCLQCGRSEPDITLVPDHITPASKGGSHAIDNIQPLCRDCNYQKGARHADYRYSE
jgi:5-methylcytosine-specific restriction endonuclease McrA